MILSDPSHWVMMTSTTLREGPKLYFGFMGGPIAFEDLVGLKTLGDLQPFLHAMGHCLNKFLMKLFFMQTGWLPKSLPLIFFQILGLVFET